MGQVRNKESIHNASLRAAVDPRFEAMHDALEAAYYGGWRQGLPSPVTVGNHTFDVVNGTPAIVQANPPATSVSFAVGRDAGSTAREKAKIFFDAVHGLLFWYYDLALHAENLSRPADQRIPSSEYDDMADEFGAVVDSRSAYSRRLLDALRARNPDLAFPDSL